MASRRIILSCLLLLVILTSSSSAAAAAASYATNGVSSSQKVKLTLYYETLCPYCARFIVNELVKLYQNGLISIVDLRLVPWGNANMDFTRSFICQHGPDECFLNTVEACAIDAWPNLKVHYDFIRCTEAVAVEGKHSQWGTCFQRLQLVPKPISDCYYSGRGNQLEQQYAEETGKLNPPHAFVPWVVVNNQPLYEDYMKFMNYICKAYKGPAIPKACKSLSLDVESFEKENIYSVCYAVQTLNSTKKNITNCC